MWKYWKDKHYEGSLPDFDRFFQTGELFYHAPDVSFCWADDNADVHQACEGTNMRDSSEYGINRRHPAGGLYGRMLILWYTTMLFR